MPPMRVSEHGLYVWDRLREPDEYADLDRQIKDLLSLDLATAEDRSLRSALNDVGRGYATRAIRILPRSPFTTFRVSRPTSLENPWNHIRDLWAPPAAFVGRGRFNERGKPVLYVSSDPHAALMETQPKPYEVRVVLMLRKRVTDHIIRVAQIGLEHLPGFYADQENFRELRGGIRAEPVLRGFFEGRGTYQYWLKQDSVLSDICAKEYAPDQAENAYRLTFEIGRQIQKIRDVDGINYPTVANGYRGQNMAFPVAVARKHLVPVQAWLFQFGGHIDPLGTVGRRYEGVVTRLGTFDETGALIWSREGRWSTDELHWKMAPPLE